MSFKLPEQEIEELRKLQRNVIGLRYYARVTCILMLALDFSPDLVAQSLSIDVATVYRYKDLYVRGKTYSLLEDRYKGYWGRLETWANQPALRKVGATSFLYRCQERVRMSKGYLRNSVYASRNGGSFEPKSALLTRRLQRFLVSRMQRSKRPSST